ncbi:hypothetical protein LRP49_15450 [Enterovibrio sp. ZSDZ35]|uniref:Antitoxin component YwqK of the YwqJK toxin-antitoxin module n=1 Tax=Enterovibrio qingdaonensis TaxID=2899818 RepID=A0ABT5QNN4_9GAMM|nr:toxin-antitoxin system YwqK family antitoxin [Enterovibrio sp. ZSDZ35]MDD1782567.1 hypothetical protein [Enterovibrio sp. ZSDZ35]
MQRLLVRSLVLASMFSALTVWASPIWLDDDWNIVKSESQASYYLREPLVERDGVWPVSVYFQGGEILNFEGTFNSGDISTGKSVGEYKIYHDNGNLLSTGSRNEKGQYEGLTRFYDENGVLTEEAEFVASKRHGITRTFYPSGQVEEEYTNKNGIVVGENLYYFEDGTVSHRFNYVDGKTDGRQLYYSRNGTVSYSVHHKMDRVHGEYTSYYENGQVSHRVNYVNDKREGIGYSYSENGFLYLETAFRNDKKHGVVRGWYAEDKLRYEENYAYGKQHGSVTHYYASGNLKRVNYLVKGIQVGSQRSYFDRVDAVQEAANINKDGEVTDRVRFNEEGAKTYEYVASFKNKKRISDEKEYRNSVLVSRIQENEHKKWQLEERFDEEGNLTRREEEVAGKRHNVFIQIDVFTDNVETTHYKHGVRHGKYFVVTPVGDTIESGTYYNGKKSGSWVWHFDGIVRTENYNRKGQLHGELTSINADGRQTVSEQYRNGQLHGLTENYSDEGGLLAKGNYIDGKRDGQWQHQEEYEYDVRIWSGEYQDGIKVGKWFARSGAGYEMGREQFDELGRKQGAFYYFGESGNLKLIVRYVDDERDGNTDSYGTDGKIYYSEIYSMGSLVMSDDKGLSIFGDNS